MEKAFLDRPGGGFIIKVHEMGQELVTRYAGLRGLPPAYLDRIDQWALGVYLFGLANGLGNKENIPPIELETAMDDVLASLFGYDAATAQRYVATWIQDLLTGDPRNVNYSIIRQAAGAYTLWKKGNQGAVAAAVLTIANQQRR